MIRRLSRLLLFVAAGCGQSPPSAAPSGKNARVDSCHYEAVVRANNRVDVEARCVGTGLAAFSSAEPLAVPFVSNVRLPSGESLAARGDAWQLPDDRDEALISYRVDLEAMGESVDDFDVALSLRGGVIAPVSSWILRPSPIQSGAPVTIRVRTADGAGFTSGLRREGDLYHLETHEIRVGTYSVFGAFRSTRFAVPGPGAPRSGGAEGTAPATIEVARLEAPLRVQDSELTEWIRDSAEAVATFWRGFPIEHTLVIVVPVRGREGVVFGKVLPAGGPGITVMVGQLSTVPRLYRDWVLVHELFHLGFPSFFGEGKWLDEGLATYYEPIIRARAGWQTPEDVWAEFADNMVKGLATVENEGLENARSFRGIYWGGALMCLAADVAARKRSNGRVGLEDGIREVLRRGGNAQHVWKLDDVMQIADERLGAPILQKLALTHADRGADFDLDGLFRDLGVERNFSGVVLHDDAPLADVRKAILGAPEKPPRRQRP